MREADFETYQKLLPQESKHWKLYTVTCKTYNLPSHFWPRVHFCHGTPNRGHLVYLLYASIPGIYYPTLVTTTWLQLQVLSLPKTIRFNNVWQHRVQKLLFFLSTLPTPSENNFSGVYNCSLIQSTYKALKFSWLALSPPSISSLVTSGCHHFDCLWTART